MPNARCLQSGICLITQPFHYVGEKGYDYYHGGIDLTDFSQGYSALGYITAHTAGQVIGLETGYTGPVEDGSYGNYVWILHANGYSTLYAHLAYGTTQVSLGQWVEQGQILAYMDNTGHSYGGHLHFELRAPGGEKIDPEPYLGASLPGMGRWLTYINGDWWCTVDGKIDYSYNGVAQNENGWWACTNGKVDYNFTGLRQNEWGWWYCKNGQVNFNANGIAKNEWGYWKVTNGQVDFGFTGLTQHKENWYYCVNGKVDTAHNSVVQNEYGWWKVTKGKVDFTYNGLAQNENGWWMIQNGGLDFGYNGLCARKTNLYVVKEGHLDSTYNGEYMFSGVKYKIKNGKVVTK